MSKALFAICLLAIPCFSGCCTQALFWAFGDYYSATGPSRDDRERHFNEQVEASDAYAAANPLRSSQSASSWSATALHDDE